MKVKVIQKAQRAEVILLESHLKTQKCHSIIWTKSTRKHNYTHHILLAKIKCKNYAKQKIKVNNLIGPRYIADVIYISNINFIDRHIPKREKKSIFHLDQTVFQIPFYFPIRTKMYSSQIYFNHMNFLKFTHTHRQPYIFYILLINKLKVLSFFYHFQIDLCDQAHSIFLFLDALTS